eukprot:CAMPEP_0175649010 /NCGR_PEP_ID=MMETSP0097-20121207/8622_1 /TAXON_ID=311494 /ORGANISM="Alexandrium monilatum, Strain CCMP3105" /LENGTH=61 /DNA_ID=CAMNT_0016954937 /DNA_START=78 /DNA_END=259 /DNA_ORIENTATION=-
MRCFQPDILRLQCDEKVVLLVDVHPLHDSLLEEVRKAHPTVRRPPRHEGHVHRGVEARPPA